MPDSVKARISLQPSSSATDAATRVRLRVIGVPGPAGRARLSPRRASARRRRIAPSAVLLGVVGDARHRLDRLHRELADRALAREHHGVGAVEDRVRHVRGLGARRPRVLDHALEHLGGGDHDLAGRVGRGDDPLLGDRHVLGAELDAQVAARDHHAVGRRQDRLQVVERLRLLDLRDHRRAPRRASATSAFACSTSCGLAHEGQRHEVDPVLDAEREVARGPSR